MSDCVVVFDVYRTLIELETDETRSSTYDELAWWLGYHGLHATGSELQAAYYRLTKQAIEASNEAYPDIDILRVFEQLLAELPAERDTKPEALIAETAVMFRILTTVSVALYPETIPVLETLRSRVRLAVVSNTQRAFTLPEMRLFGIADYFECVVFSSDVGACKPSPRIFEAALSLLGARTSDVVHVGDNLFDDVHGAQSLGIRTLWIDRGDGVELPSSLARPVPDRTVRGDAGFRAIADAALSLLA